MHELPITQHIIEICEKHCREAGAQRVRLVKLVIGDYSGYVGSSVQMYFDIISEGTLCEGAQVEIEHVKPKLRCPSCGTLFQRQLLSFACPECGTDGEPTEIGKEFYIDSIEVEQ
ncbi:MAG: hydrogenase maturation nickel metallochaperone HypA [Firmicutes bacterium]|nr:hydrogenase maturation nickel metallochaperone HypA [Bacillota bacterium]